MALFVHKKAPLVATMWFCAFLGFTALIGFDLSFVMEIKMAAHVALSFVVQQAALWSPIGR